MIYLTRPDGQKMAVRPEDISLIEPDNDKIMGGNTIIRIDGENHGVMETVDQIRWMIKP